MSGYQHFKSFLDASKSNLKTLAAGGYIPEKLNALLKNKGVILVSQKNVRDIDLAVKELTKANEAIASALAALHYFQDVDNKKLIEAQAVTAEYKAVLVDVVEKAYVRRQAAVVGVAA
jgi:tetrahydromethanopterin S-methyltransferase subunit F